MFNHLLPALPAIQKPARYVGGEVGSVVKDKSVDIRFAFCFPDTYEIGSSCLALGILYDLINALPWAWCERAFAPWEDMRDLLLRTKTPLYALESGDALRDFDVLGFTLQYELSYTNILSMLDLAGIPLLAADRQSPVPNSHGRQISCGVPPIAAPTTFPVRSRLDCQLSTVNYPLVIAGGPCAFHPEPLADFIDLFIVGEGEEVTVELLELVRDWKHSGASKAELLADAAKIPGIYVPSLYTSTVGADGRLASIEPNHPAAPPMVSKRLIANLDTMRAPHRVIVPSMEAVHDRAAVELFRGCARGCRFCQAGFISRPVREKSPETIAAQAIDCVENAGFGELGLVSLSTSDYTGLEPLCNTLLDWSNPRRVNLSLPSLRADTISPALLEKMTAVRKSGLTIAPEAGTQRMRNVINKNLTEDDIFHAAEEAFRAGYGSIKLYFMIGLPTERDEDCEGIADLCGRLFGHWRHVTEDRSRGMKITASAACFIPKPHTPFQWEPMATAAELDHKAYLVKHAMRKQVNFRWHQTDTSVVEAAFARGDRRLGRVLLRAYESGCRMDGWSEWFDFAKWQAAFGAEGLDIADFANRERRHDEVLPWEHISCGVSKSFLARERNRAYNAETTVNCINGCAGCGHGCA